MPYGLGAGFLGPNGAIDPERMRLMNGMQQQQPQGGMPAGWSTGGGPMPTPGGGQNQMYQVPPGGMPPQPANPWQAVGGGGYQQFPGGAQMAPGGPMGPPGRPQGPMPMPGGGGGLPPGQLPPRLQQAISAGQMTPEQAAQRFQQFQGGQLPAQQAALIERYNQMNTPGYPGGTQAPGPGPSMPSNTPGGQQISAQSPAPPPTYSTGLDDKFSRTFQDRSHGGYRSKEEGGVPPGQWGPQGPAPRPQGPYVPGRPAGSGYATKPGYKPPGQAVAQEQTPPILQAPQEKPVLSTMAEMTKPGVRSVPGGEDKPTSLPGQKPIVKPAGPGGKEPVYGPGISAGGTGNPGPQTEKSNPITRNRARKRRQTI